MNAILYLFVFLIGITFGSFFTLAVYRIPLGQDITHKRSYCPNCNHKLSFFDMIPVFSYIFLGGKCRYCHQKIRIRYLLLEVLSGLVFVLFAISMKFNIYNLNAANVAYYTCGSLYFVGLFIIAGIDKERIQISNGTLLYTIIMEVLYIIYLYIVENANIYRYVIYLFLIIVLVVINNIYFIKKLKNNYTLQIIILILTMIIFTYEYCTLLAIILTLLIVGLSGIFKQIKNKKINKIKKTDKKISQIPIAYYLCVSNIIMVLFINFIAFYRG